MTPEEIEKQLLELDAEFDKASDLPLPSGLLYHYTDAVGLEGILRSGCMRATHCLYLNDRRELIEGRDVVRRATDELAYANPSTARRLLIRGFQDAFDTPMVSELLEDTYVASFSEKRDDLGQWRAYGARGAGYAIGIQILRRPENAPPGPGTPQGDTPISSMLVPCEYEHEAAKERIKAALHELFEAMERRLPTFGADAAALARLQTRGIVIGIRLVAEHWLRIKNGSFKDEAEWRYVAGVTVEKRREGIKLRPTASRGLIPYVDIPLRIGTTPYLEVEQIIVGPTLHPKEGVLAAVMLLETLGYDRARAKAIVVSSKIPFRG